MISVKHILGSSFVCHFGLCAHFSCLIVKWLELGLSMSNYKDKKNRYYDKLYSYNNSNKSGKISPVYHDEIEIIGTRPSLNKKISPIGWDIFFTCGSIICQVKYISCIEFVSLNIIIVNSFVNFYRDSIKLL